MLYLIIVIYTLGCILCGPIFGQAEKTKDGVLQAMAATAVWPLIVIWGLIDSLRR